MIRNSMRSTRLLSWRCLRWAIAIPTMPLVWWACTSHPLTQPNPSPEQQTDIYISVAPNRLLDLVFMVDNSPSMAPKVAKMNAQFPKLIAALKDPETIKRLQDIGTEPTPMTPDEFKAYIAAENASWKDVITKSGLPPM